MMPPVGQETTVRSARSLGEALKALAGDGAPCQIAMVDGQLVHPSATPPAVWAEVRLRTAAGMITLRRRGDEVSVVTFGNAAAEVLQMRDRIAAAMSMLAMFILFLGCGSKGSSSAVSEPDAAVPTDPAPGEYGTRAPMLEPNSEMAVAAMDGRIYVAGGRYNGGGFDSPRTDSLDMFDPGTNGWVAKRPMLRPRGGMAGVVAFGCFHVYGGEGTNTGEPNDVYPDHDVYDPTTDTWTAAKRLAVPIHGVIDRPAGRCGS